MYHSVRQLMNNMYYNPVNIAGFYTASKRVIDVIGYLNEYILLFLYIKIGKFAPTHTHMKEIKHILQILTIFDVYNSY